MSKSEHLTINSVKINDEFWNNVIDTVRCSVIPYQYHALQDQIEGAEKSHCIDNFKKAKAVKNKLINGIKVKKHPVDKWYYDEKNSDKSSFMGWVFQDSDVYKWIEAVGYSLQNHPDPELERNAKKIIDIVCDAQLENGYLDTLYIINDIDKAFTNLKDHHELYCLGHLCEGAISFYNATGDDKLLNTAYRFADLVYDTFGPDKKRGYCGHEIAEMALFKLYKTSGNKKYLELSKFFIDERGKKPYYFDIEQGKKTFTDNYHYNQAHIQPKYQKEAVGHAVRGVYLYSAMADIAKQTNDERLKSACKDIWDNIADKKLYITGGIGSTVDGEAFSYNYDLPNDLAYAETCASIGLIFFARRMAELEPNAKYFDVAERALYNTVLSGMSEDGKSFFYVNPLEVLPEASHKDSRKSHIKTVRQKWFSCACCPPNLARLISSLNEYIYTDNDETLFINLYICSSAKTRHCDLEYCGDKIKITNVKQGFELALRIPEYCDNFEISENYELSNGYAIIKVNKDCEIGINFNTEPKLVMCSNKVRANIGKVAVTRGAFVYCLEEIDNGSDLHLLSIDTTKKLEYIDGCIYAKGYREKPDYTLYSNYKEREYEECTLKFIPYYRWANRGENEMCVYVRIRK